jgi:large subunit ribosomal protein L13
VKTYIPNAQEVNREWFVIDAQGQTLGRLATEIANILRGKNKPHFTPHMDCGDFVIVINAEKIEVTGSKETAKMYRRHSGYPGGFKEESLKHLRARRPEVILERAVRGMLPHTRLGDRQFTKLNVYAGASHPHDAQKPKALELKASVAGKASK